MTADADVWGPPRAFLAYDLPAESRHFRGSAKPSQKLAKALLAQRMAIYYELKVKFRMTTAQQSLWNIRDEAIIPALEASMAEWLQWYEARGYTARLKIVRVRGDAAAEETFEQWELNCLREWLGNLQESCEKIEKQKQCSTKHWRQLERKFELLAAVVREDFQGSVEVWPELEDELQVTRDALMQAKRLAA